MLSFKICQRCVLDNIEVPDITFNGQGVCNYCEDWIRREKVRKMYQSEGPLIMDKMRRERIKRKEKYDCLLGLSGGVDSSLCLHYLVQNDIKPLCWSLDNGYNDPKADENVLRMVEKLKVPYQKLTIDLVAFKGLQASFMKAGVKNIEIPTDHILAAAQYQLAERYNIKYIVGGGNHATEGIMPESYGYNARDLTHIKAINRMFNNEDISGLPLMSLPKYIYYRFIRGIQVVNLLDYYDYDRDRAINLLEDEYGYRQYGEKHCENVFTKWFQNFYLLKKWGLDKRKPHYSSMINSGQMKRETALNLLKEYNAYPELGIEQRVMNYQKKDHMDYPNSKWAWDLLTNVYAHLKRGD